MKKSASYILSLLLLTTLLSVGCSNDDTPKTGNKTPITFAVNMEDYTTRTYTSGCIDYSILADAGFGVYAYGLSGGNWYNREVSYIGETPTSTPTSITMYPGNWSYGTEEDWGEQSVSFYTYAPYGTNQCVSALSPASGTADPTLTYTIATDPTQSVDLLWGINNTTGKPWTNATLANTGGPVLFTFYHALAAIGFHVQAMVDKTNNTSNYTDISEVANLLDTSGKYKITVKKLTLSGNFYSTATLNLNNTTERTPAWDKDNENLTAQTLTVNNSLINADFKHPDDATTTPEKATTIMSDNTLPGITQDAQQLLIANNAADKEQCFFVIPNDAQDYTVSIDWCISGQAPDNSYIFEDRTSTINIPSLTLEAGTKYYLNFVIGLRSLQLNVTATDWSGTSQDITTTIEHGTSANSSLAPQRP